VPLQEWLQERQYASPYHWRQRPNDEREYQLRTRIALDLAQLIDLSDGPSSQNGGRRRLLDVGCGDGRFVADAVRAARTIGVDVSRRALGFARELVPDARFVASGGQALPFANESFDVVTLLDVIEHVPDADELRVVREAARVLRPGGHLVISTNTDRSAREWKHYRHYPLARFRALFDGFTDVRLVGLIPYFPTLRFWMASPVVWRCLRSRVRSCDPSEAQVVIGAGRKCLD
jgi:SAM-dependent methyltransferase